jgi:hypothetical protein
MEDELLHLTARAVARANIENIDRLGAFNGATDCRYHYDEPGLPSCTDCAIGVVDVDRCLVGNASIYNLRKRRRVVYSDEDAPVLTFIQRLHDCIVMLGCGRGAADGELVRDQLFLTIPPCCADLFATITEFNKDTYRQIMELIAAS